MSAHRLKKTGSSIEPGSAQIGNILARLYSLYVDLKLGNRTSKFEKILITPHLKSTAVTQMCRSDRRRLILHTSILHHS